MTELDMLIQELRHNIEGLEENIKELKMANESLKIMHQLDMAEIVKLRRQVESAMEGQCRG